MKPVRNVLYSVTRRDIRDAILLANILGSNPPNDLWCGGWQDGPGRKAPCGHYGDWQCAADAIGASSIAASLLVAATNRITEAWVHGDVEDLEVRALRHVTVLFSDNLEAELMLREGWLPPNHRITRKHHPDTGRYISLVWENTPDAYYVRGHVDREEFARALIAYFGEDRAPFGPQPITRHAHAFWAMNGRDYLGDPNRTLRECGADPRGGSFAITVMDVEDNPLPPMCRTCHRFRGCTCASTTEAST